MSRRALGVAVAFVLVYASAVLLVLIPLQERSSRRPEPEWCRGLRWQTVEAGLRAPVALASFPGSGNTWLRYLLQQSTGVLTGSVYFDYSLRMHGFPAENITSPSTLVVKTHELPGNMLYRAAVLLIRHPRDAILADFNRIHKGHVGTAPISAFRSMHGKRKWERHVISSASGWRHFYYAWLQCGLPLHIIHYERLVHNTYTTLEALLAFLNYTVSLESLECAMAHKEGIYRRRARVSWQPYTPELIAITEEAWRGLLLELSSKRNF